MTKIYKKNNYIIIDDTVTKSEFLANNIIIIENENDNSYSIFNVLVSNSLIININISDIYNETGIAYTSAEWFNFYTLNTGISTINSTSYDLKSLSSIVDIDSSILTTSVTTSAILPNSGLSYSTNIVISAISGTSPSLDLNIEESDDNGLTWYLIYSFPRITAAGTYRSPKLELTGTKLRYVQTVLGTTPSITRSINRIELSSLSNTCKQLIDRTIVLSTLNSVTPSLILSGNNILSLVVNIGTATTAPQIQLEGSDDNGLSYYNIGSPLTTIASSSVSLSITNLSPQQIRAKVSSAGVAVVLGYVLIKSFS